MNTKKSFLTPADYINGALLVVEEEGIEHLSMRKIAATLGVTPMAVYNHFKNKEALLAHALDAFIARANVIPENDLPWKVWVEKMAQAMFAALCQERQWLPLLNKMPLGQEASSVTDSFVKKLMNEGFSRNEASKLFFAMLQIVVGGVCLQPTGSTLQQTPIALTMILKSYDSNK